MKKFEFVLSVPVAGVIKMKKEISSQDTMFWDEDDGHVAGTERVAKWVENGRVTTAWANFACVVVEKAATHWAPAQFTSKVTRLEDGDRLGHELAQGPFFSNDNAVSFVKKNDPEGTDTEEWFDTERLLEALPFEWRKEFQA